MHTCRTRLCRDTVDGGFHIIGCREHQIRKLIYENNYLRQFFRRRIVLYRLVVLREIALARSFENIISALHLGHSPVEGACCLLRVKNNGHKQMRYSVIHIEFNLFRVDEDKLHLVGLCLIENTDDK